MKDRIRQIMESLHMSQQVFAGFIGANPATLSGIFNDRNRPTLNIVEAIKKKIPDISTDWLMFGTGNMYMSSSTSNAEGQDAAIATVAGREQGHEGRLDFDDAPSPPLAVSAPAAHTRNGVRNTRQEFRPDEVRFVDKQLRRVTEIRVYYDDQTWESFVPSKK